MSYRTKEITNTTGEAEKCAPHKKYEEGSCYTMEDLVKMAHSYNNFIHMGRIVGKKLIVFDEATRKGELVRQLHENLKHLCDDQLCWLKQDFVKVLKDDELVNNTFRPKGPQGRFDWLSTIDIEKVASQYHAKYPDFQFLGANPLDFYDLPFLKISTLDFDELIENGIERIGMVINLDEHWKPGSHWVAFFANLKTSEVYYFDSYGISPCRTIRKFMHKVAKWCASKHDNARYTWDHLEQDLRRSASQSQHGGRNLPVRVDYNRNRWQYRDSECGVYSLFFILNMLKHNNFDKVVNQKVTDEQVNECRRVYFRNT
jgi:hypothetical protein